MQQIRLLCVFLTIVNTLAKDGNSALPVYGTGATFPAEVYETWISSFENARRDFISLDMKYAATGSLVGKLALQNSDIQDTIYAGTDSEMTPLEYIANPDLHMVPVMAGSVYVCVCVCGGRISTVAVIVFNVVVV